MITLFQIIFWVPAIILVSIICYLMKWNKERMMLAFLTIPVLYFVVEVFDYKFFEPDYVFIRDLIGLILSVLLVIYYLVRLNKKH
ncbi:MULTISPECIES: hypothetical protein [unclassified Enterococcus]|uniref:hypothetical protein n=1 Tax=unclassified Enterococcus TaxID=2608891 RepID=UPI0013EB1339|nr:MULTISPECIES: hypothetical protein [unclassified Enterococcus]